MPSIEEIQAKCPDVSFKAKPSGYGWTCRFYRDHVCIAAGHNGADCIVFPRQESLGLGGPVPVAQPAPTPPPPAEPASDVLGLDTPETPESTPEGENVAGSPGYATIQGVESRVENQVETATDRPIWDMTWSASRINTFLRCPYKFYLHYIEGLRPETPPDWAVYGSAMHEALENLFRGRGLIFESTGRPQVDAKIAGKLDGLAIIGVLGMIRDSEDWVVEGKIDFEYRYESPTPGCIDCGRSGYLDLRWTTRLDLCSSDGTVLADWKSTGGDVAGIRSIDVLYQMSTYCMAKPNVSEVRIFPIFKPRLKLKRTENIEEFRDRVRQDVIDHPAKYHVPHIFSRAEIQPEKHFATLCGVVARVIECIKEGESAFPRNAGDCSFGAPCEYEAECMRRV